MLGLITALVSAISAVATPDPLPDDPQRPVEKIGHGLNIKPEHFKSCFRSVSPSPQGTRPTSERVHANKAVLLGCLQKANPDISNDMLDSVMDKYRPGGREAQTPISREVG